MWIPFIGSLVFVFLVLLYAWRTNFRFLHGKRKAPDVRGGQLSCNVLNRYERDDKIVFLSDTQRDWVDDVPYFYVQEVVEHYFPGFDMEMYSELLADDAEMSPEQLKEQWNAHNEEARKVGQFMHQQIARRILGKQVQMNYNFMFTGKHLAVNRWVSIITEMNQFQQFWLSARLRPFRVHWIVYDEEHHLVACIDLIAQDEQGRYVMYNWVRSQRMGCETNDGFLLSPSVAKSHAHPPIAHVPDTSFHREALQMNMARLLLQQHYHLSVSNMYIVILHAHHSEFHLLDVPLMVQEASVVLSCSDYEA